jgi:hypothetical protein
MVSNMSTSTLAKVSVRISHSILACQPISPLPNTRQAFFLAPRNVTRCTLCNSLCNLSLLHFYSITRFAPLLCFFLFFSCHNVGHTSHYLLAPSFPCSTTYPNAPRPLIDKADNVNLCRLGFGFDFSLLRFHAAFNVDTAGITPIEAPRGAAALSSIVNRWPSQHQRSPRSARLLPARRQRPGKPRSPKVTPLVFAAPPTMIDATIHS